MTTVSYERRGIGRAVVMLHGIGHDRRAWDPVIDLLVPHCELLLIDLPGHGASPLPADAGQLGISELTDHIEAFLAELQLERPIVVGNSMGGAIALELARRGKASSVVALAPIGFWSRLEVRYVVLVLHVSRFLARLLAGVPALLRLRAVRAALLALYFARPLRLSRTDALRTTREFAHAPGLTAILPFSRRYRFETSSGIDEGSVTVAWGAKDRLLVGPQPRRARALLPRARHVLLPDCGHVLMSDNPTAVARLILTSTGPRRSE